jgi:hypothetical protein
MDRRSTVSRLADVEADLVYLAPMAELAHSHIYDPPPGVPRTYTATGASRESIELRAIAFHVA